MFHVAVTRTVEKKRQRQCFDIVPRELNTFYSKNKCFLTKKQVPIKKNNTCDKYFNIFAMGDTEKRHSSLGT